MSSNYTDEQVEHMCKVYQEKPSMSIVLQLAAELDKPKKSIIGKLSREGVYRREPYKTKLGETPITKIEIVHIIASQVNVEPDDLLGLDKAPKAALKTLQRGLNDII
jgi:hypothetical protein